MDKLYYIETSDKRIYFGSSNLKEMMLKKNYGSVSICDNIEMSCNLIDALNPKYKWDSITVELTPNGFFMKITLSDNYYGSPEFKIFEA